MCGITGWFNHGARTAPNREEVIRMRDRMASRGPDGKGLWTAHDQSVVLGHRRLSFVDLSESGAQPMLDASGTSVIVYNGEIYNYQKLRHDLESRGQRFQSHSDTEVLLYLFKTRGESMLSDLRGMYAFAIWDDERQELFLARDPFGIKPLYYCDDGSSFRFASQVKALLESRAGNFGIDAAAQIQFFLWGYVPDPLTLYKGIRALPAGHSLRIGRDGQAVLKEFCNIPQILIEAERHTGHGLPLAERDAYLRAIIQDSVSNHLIADVPVGIFQSAGLDSSTITALASREHSDLRTVSLGFQEYRGTENDETPLAAKVAEACGTQHQTQWISKNDFLGDLDHLFYSMDQPSIDGVNTYFVSKVTAATGLKGALSGVGGDELLAGYPSYRDIPRIVGLMANVPSSLGRAFRQVSHASLRRFISPKYAGLMEYGGTYGGAYLLRRGLFMPWELPELMDADVVREGWKQLQPAISLDRRIEKIKGARSRVTALELTSYMRDQLLRDADWAGMAHSLEIRVPFVDIELFRKIAPLLMSPQPPVKADMARFMQKLLPDEVLNRRKTGFSTPIQQWLGPENGRSQERGLRGWAKVLANEFRMPGLKFPESNAVPAMTTPASPVAGTSLS